VSVAAADCADANIATTAALLRGASAPAWLAAQRLPARLVDWPGEVLTLAGWPAGGPRAGTTPPSVPGGRSEGPGGRTLAA
jgi:thiamine biosynthesis lipoprotein